MQKNLLPIEAVARKLDLTEDLYEKRSPVTAKLSLALLRPELWKDARFRRNGKLILVTATTPTLFGEGKTVTSIGLVQGIEKIGKRAVLASREPSLGPVFGMKGGAAGGGRSQVEPAEKINLHFHGDFHAISSAHNLLAALIDSHMFHGNELDLDPEGITWPRTLDMNDRALRRITVSVTAADKKQRDGSNRPSGFLITAASEIMAILALASDRQDLRARLARIVIGQDRKGNPVRAADLNATGPMMALLHEALMPNLAQTTEGTPAMVHCGPFANIAHGTSSVVSQKMGMQMADYVVNETGFASDLGFEKYMDLVSPLSGIKPSAAVLVTTVQSVKQQGEGDLERGAANLEKHISIVRGFGLPVVVAINRFPNDTEEELNMLRKFCEARGAEFALSEAYAKGGEGAVALAQKVVEVIEANPEVQLTTTYALGDSIVEKITKVAQKIYGADAVELSDRAKENLERFTRWDFGELPICIAKTQYSLSDDPRRLGAPAGWTLHVTDIALSAGAGFLVVISGSMMLMPGLPKVSRALGIDVDEHGEIIGMS
ncbi:formate--tetrahydrofolate ligase [Silvibacterium dinghuense]|uniref:Formate--tetrahydrofolate ligase n=1 Tax=Silvibacterium dinghuense TaxID=1560006 RepID=A0A4Q1SHK8_9BACT|nr:formate--tetrahydrofolate ligase [Silvibacterium dinghuense]RXS96847.1 formate--tetrahydrofolate ligase [Silvibacterium dinghuense]GGG94136.1 formate--tetrahydrofolate ligase [Silvibacterium dinghuense]